MLSEQILVFFQIIFIDLVLAGDNAIIIGMVASKFPPDQRKKIIYLLASFKTNSILSWPQKILLFEINVGAPKTPFS